MQENATPMTLCAEKARLRLSGTRELLSEGMAGVVEIHFTCSEDWDGLTKTAVFSNGTVRVDVPEDEWTDGACILPAEVLAQAGKTVFAGLLGTDGGAIVLPTVWCALGRVEAAPALAGQGTGAESPLVSLGRRVGALEDALPLILDGVGATLAEIAAAQGPVLLNAGGTLLPLTALSDAAAEFTGPVTGGQYEVYRITEDGLTRTEHSLGAGAELFTVTLTRQETTLTADKTLAEVLEAVSGGSQVQLIDADGCIFPLRWCASATARFCGIGTNSALGAVCYDLTSAGVTRTEGSFYQLPDGGIPDSDLAGEVQGRLGRIPLDVSFANGVYSVTPTPAEIYDLMQIGADIVAVLPDGLQLQMLNCSQTESVFCGVSFEDGVARLETVCVNEQGVTYQRTPLQTAAITDAGGYFTADSVEGALAELGAELMGLGALLGGGIE